MREEIAAAIRGEGMDSERAVASEKRVYEASAIFYTRMRRVHRVPHQSCIYTVQIVQKIKSHPAGDVS